MTAHILGILGQVLGLFSLVVIVFLFVRSLLEKRGRTRTDRIIEEIVQHIDTASLLIRNSFEIDVKRIAIESLLEELRRSEAVSLKFAEALCRLAKDFERQRKVIADVLGLLSVGGNREERLPRARDLLCSEYERTLSVVERDRKETHT